MAFSKFSDFLAFVVAWLTCSLNVSLRSKVSPRIFGLVSVGMVVPFIERDSLVLYSAGSGVNRVAYPRVLGY